MDPPNPNPNFSALIDPQSYARTKQMIQNARIYMNQVEAQNEAGLQAFAYTEQELQRRIREGREAEMLAAHLRAGNLPQQTFIAQQPQVTNWQVPPIPLPSTHQEVLSTSARIEEVPSVSSGRTSRSGSHPTLQRGDSSYSHWSQQFPQSEAPQNTNVTYEQSFNHSNVPVQTTFISRDFHSGQPSRRQSYYAPPTVTIPPAPVQQPPPPPVHQPPPQQEPLHPVASAASPTSSYPVPAHNISGPPPSTEQNQSTARRDFVKQLLEILQRFSYDVQVKAITQIIEYANGKPTPNPQIRMLGDKLKQVGGSDQGELMNLVLSKLSEQRKAQRAARSQTNQPQPQPQAEPLPQPPPTPQPQFQTVPSEQPPQLQTTSVAANHVDDSSFFSPSELQIMRNLLPMYFRELKEAKIDGRRVGDIVSDAYVSVCQGQPPSNSDVWVQRTLETFGKHLPMDLLPRVFACLLQQLKRPIPNIPSSAEPRTEDRSSSSLATALAGSTSNVAPSTVMHQSSVEAQPPKNDTVMQTGPSDVVPEMQIPQPRDPASTTVPWTQVTGNAPHVSTHTPSSRIILTDSHHTTANHHTTTVPGDAARRVYQPMEYNQLAVVPRRNFSNAIPNLTQREVRQLPPSGWTPYYKPEAPVSTIPKEPPIKIRLPREADRSRLAKDILKQLGKPSGSVPAVPTKREYEKRKKAEAEVEDASVRPSTGPVAEPQLVSGRNDPPLPPEVVPVPGQPASPDLSANPPPITPAGEPPLFEYPDPPPDLIPRAADAIEQDVNMDIQPPEDLLVPRPPASPRSIILQDSVPSPTVPEPALGEEEKSTADHPSPSESVPSKRSRPPPDAEIIEISDDEEQPTVDAITTIVEPMEVDEVVGTSGAISQSLSELSLDGGDTRVAMETEGDRSKEPLGRRSSQELAISGDTQFTERKSRKGQPYVELPPLLGYARRSKGKERAPIQEEDEEDPELQAVADLAFSRLRPTRCLWLGCKVTLNSVDNLIKHLKIHAEETERTSDNLECQWKKCTRSYRTRVKLDRHCVHHAQKVLHCPYEDCGEEFRDAGELLDHTRDMHENSDLLPSTDPVPYTGRALGALPEQIPSWSIFPASVGPVPISVDRHGQVGRWVARNICGMPKRPDPSRRLRSSRRFDTGKQRSTASEVEDMMNEERFGFLSSTDDGNTTFTDIPSEAVSSYCRHGLVTLSDNDDHLGVARGSRERLELEGVDLEDGLARADIIVEEDMISLELEPVSSEDELLLKPASS